MREIGEHWNFYQTFYDVNSVGVMSVGIQEYIPSLYLHTYVVCM